MPTRSQPAETAADQWQAVGWMVANVAHEPLAIRRALADLDQAAFTDDGAALVLQAIREVCERPAPALVEIIAICRRLDPEFSPARLAQEIHGTAGTHERVLRAAVAAIAEGNAQRRYRDALDDAAAGGLSPEARRAGVERIQATFRDTLPDDADATDAANVALRWSEQPNETLFETGFPTLDRRFGGGLPAGITAISAMPGVGKSALAAMLMLGALERDRELQAVWFRGEMTERLLWSRFLAAWSAIRAPAVPRITRRDASSRSASAQKVNADLALVAGGRLHIEPPPMTPARIVSAIERRRPRLVVVDYLQRCTAAGMPDKRSEIDHVLAVLSDLTTERDLATIVVSSMAKGTTGNADIGGMTKESNRLDFDAHTYLALWSDKRDRDRDPRPVRLEIAKGRTGGEGAVDLWFSGSSQTFTPQATEEQERAAADFAGFEVEAGR